MENNFQIITKEDLKSLGISSYVQDLILEGVNFEELSLEDLFKLINNLTTLLTQVMKMNSNGKSYSYSYQQIRKNTFKQIVLTGGFLTFRLRQFLLQETIYYSLGATDERGQLFQREMSQDELWSSSTNKNTLALRSSLSSKAILLSKSLEKFNKDDFQQVGSLNLWPKVLDLAFGGPSVKDPSDPSYGKYYQKDNKDDNVYVRYTEGRRKAKKNYYYKKGEEFLFYNQGWLYEWYLTYINKSIEHEQFLQQSIKNNTIAPIMYGMDNVAGITAGDFVDAKGRQVQAKFHNQQIITFNNILNMLLEIKTILSEFIKHPTDSQIMAEKFVNIFTSDDASVNHLNTTYNEIVEKQLLSLIKNKN